VIVALLAAVALECAPVALAFFSKAAGGGPLTVATSTLVAPGQVTATQVNCDNNGTPEIEVTWSATSSSYATSYTLERATASNGPYTSVSSVPIGRSSYTDSGNSPRYSTTYYYRVQTVYRSWNATSAPASVTTLNRFCEAS
jgi:hypothetical protein